MPNRRITEFPAILAGDIVDEDILTLVDVFEVDPSLRNKKITFSGFREYLNQYFKTNSKKVEAINYMLENNNELSNKIAIRMVEEVEMMNTST